VHSVRNQLKSAHPLDGYNAARIYDLHRTQYCVMAFGLDGPATIPQFNMWAAIRTCIRLRVESPVERVFIFAPACGAHRKGTHRRVLTIIGESLDNRESRAAIRAVGEGIQISPI